MRRCLAQRIAPRPDGTAVARSLPPQGGPPGRRGLDAHGLRPCGEAEDRRGPAAVEMRTAGPSSAVARDRKPSRSRPSARARAALGERGGVAQRRGAGVPPSRATPTVRRAVIARPTSTAEATIPRTESTRIEIDAIATSTTVSTTRSTTIVPRIVDRGTPDRSPRSSVRTSSPSRAGRMLFAR